MIWYISMNVKLLSLAPTATSFQTMQVHLAQDKRSKLHLQKGYFCQCRRTAAETKKQAAPAEGLFLPMQAHPDRDTRNKLRLQEGYSCQCRCTLPRAKKLTCTYRAIYQYNVGACQLAHDIQVAPAATSFQTMQAHLDRDTLFLLLTQ